MSNILEITLDEKNLETLLLNWEVFIENWRSWTNIEIEQSLNKETMTKIFKPIIYILTYWQDALRTDWVWDEEYFYTKDDMFNRLKHLLLEYWSIGNVNWYIDLNWEELCQYQYGDWNDKVYFTTDTLDIN